MKIVGEEPSLGFQTSRFNAGVKNLTNEKNLISKKSVEEIDEKITTINNEAAKWQSDSVNPSMTFTLKERLIKNITQPFKMRKITLLETDKERITILDNHIKAEDRDQIKISYFVSNLKRVAGYVPIVGTVVGVYNIYRASTLADTTSKAATAKHILRGVVETVSLGVCFLPFDLAVTVYRQLKHKGSSSSE